MSNWDDEIRDAVEPADLFDKPDINAYIYDYESEWLEVWELAPVETMTDGQIDAMIGLISDHDFDDMSWDELLEYLADDFWEWFNEAYGSSE